MDIALTIVSGIGLRVFLFAARAPNKLIAAVLGVWEGVILHQVSGRSSAPSVDHLLAYSLRLAVDFLLSRDLQHMFMFMLWTVLAAVMSEIAFPHAALRAEFNKARDREKERRQRRTRSVPAIDVPIIAVPLPPRIRAYKPPERNQAPVPELLENAPPQSSTPVFSTDQPPTPPSFFLQATPISPSPKPVYLPTLHSADSSPREALPVRPRSGLVSTLDQSPDSYSPPPLPVLLPTPPDSAQSSILPGDIRVEVHDEEPYDNQILGFAPDLAPIPEMSSSENNSTPQADQAQIIDPPDDDNDNDNDNDNETMSDVLQPPDWLIDQTSMADPDPFFLKPFSPTMPPEAAAPVPVPIPVRRPQSSLWHSDLNDVIQPVLQFGEIKPHEDVKLESTDASDEPQSDSDELRTPGARASDDPHSDSDELRTPGARAIMNLETDNEYDPDPLQTPQQLLDQLSPLVLNVRSSLADSDSPNDPEPTPEPAQNIANTPQRDTNPMRIPGALFQILDVPPLDSANNDSNHMCRSLFQTPQIAHPQDDTDETQNIGSISQNLLLQPPLAPSPLFRSPPPPPASPPPPSPSTILSDPSDISVLSTRHPGKLYSRADELRKKARDEEKLRAQLDGERRLAESQGRVMDALRLKVQIKDMDAAAYKLHEKAARRYYVARNPQALSNKIDVHGLRPREAFDRIERAIVRANQENKTTIHVIVGKGLHSVNQQPTLKPAVIREMQRLRIPCEINPRNPGQLIITLPRSGHVP